jgi:ribosomal protein L11 methyltransferase
MLKPPYTQYSRIYTYHLEGTGITSIADPDFIGMWEEDGRIILIFHKPKDELVSELCRQYGCQLFYQADLDYADWEMGREVEPFTVGSLTVAPIWSPEKADIRIDPSVVFGNGFHPSTRLCLESIVNYHTKLPRNFTALDLGCGTGLLAVGAARLGASSVRAVDYNSLACVVTEQNAGYNKVENIVSVDQLDLRKKIPATNVDLIMANLHYELLGKLLRDPLFWQAQLYILSGFMPGEEEHLLASLPDSPPPFLERRRQDKWCVWIMGRFKA